MKKNIRNTALMLLCLALLAGCGDSGSTPNASGSAPDASEGESARQSGGEEAAKSEEAPSQEQGEPLHISIIAYPQSGYTPVDGTETQKYLEERFNVEFEVVPVETMQAEQFNLYFAQGGTADVVMACNQPSSMLDQGLFREISWQDILDRMPNWMAKMEELVGDAQLVEQLSRYNGANYCIPFSHGPVVESGIMIARKDWMDKLGIESVTNLEEFEAMLEAFTKQDPDGNGVDDTYGIHGGQRYRFNYVWGAYGIMPDSYIVRDDKTVFTSVTDEYKEVLKLLNRWYSAGYIDPEFVTDDRTMQRNKWSEGKIGVLEDNAFWCDSARGDGGVLAMVEAKDENARFAFLDPFEGPDGKKGSFVDFPSVTGDGAVYFGADASDEVVYKMMEIKEALATEWELYQRCYYGVEGTDYTVDENGKLALNPELDAEKITQKGIRQTWGLMPVTFEWMSKTMNERDEQVHNMSLSQPTVYNGVAFAIQGTNEARQTKGEDMKKVVDEYYLNAITGKVDIDATWDSYVEDAMNAGLADILAEYDEIRIK